MTSVEENILKNLSVDCVIFGFKNQELNVLLIKLNVDPSKGEWALPGGNIKIDEDLDEAARRVLFASREFSRITLWKITRSVSSVFPSKYIGRFQGKPPSI